MQFLSALKDGVPLHYYDGATDKQKAFMDRLKIKYDKYISKREASRLIRRKLEGGGRDE